MEQTATVPKLFHWRMVALLSLLWLVDSMLIVFATECILIEGASVMIMFASEVSHDTLRDKPKRSPRCNAVPHHGRHFVEHVDEVRAERD